MDLVDAQLMAKLIDSFRQQFCQNLFTMPGRKVDGDNIVNAPEAELVFEPEPTGPIIEQAMQKDDWRQVPFQVMFFLLKSPKGVTRMVI